GSKRSSAQPLTCCARAPSLRVKRDRPTEKHAKVKRPRIARQLIVVARRLARSRSRSSNDSRTRLVRRPTARRPPRARAAQSRGCDRGGRSPRAPRGGRGGPAGGGGHPGGRTL